MVNPAKEEKRSDCIHTWHREQGHRSPDKIKNLMEKDYPNATKEATRPQEVSVRRHYRSNKGILAKRLSDVVHEALKPRDGKENSKETATTTMVPQPSPSQSSSSSSVSPLESQGQRHSRSSMDNKGVKKKKKRRKRRTIRSRFIELRSKMGQIQGIIVEWGFCNSLLGCNSIQQLQQYSARR